jgi:hypothetical protein
MTAKSLYLAFGHLSTPLIADAAVRLKIPFRISPPGSRSVTPNQSLAGPALPVRHFGSVDIFLKRRAIDPSYTFRQHLQRISGAIEE